MDVLRHNHVSQDYESITPANPLKSVEEQITESCVIEERLPAITTER
jgi:hypothetical protein